jgi:type I restriction enzyme S subunit
MKLPTGWREATLSEVATLGSGGTPEAKNSVYYDGDIPWAVIGDLNDSVVRSTARSITQRGLDNSSAKVVPVDTILLGMYGSIGKLGIAGVQLATNQAIATIRAGEQVDHRYLFYYLLGQRRDLDRQGKGATQRNISQTVLKPWPIRFPDDLDEQRRIVALLEGHLSRLDAADAYLGTSRRRLSRMEQAALANCRDGDLLPLADVTEIQGGIQKQPKRAPRENVYPFLRVANVTARGLELDDVHQIELFDGELDRLKLQAGDLLVVEGNGSASQIGRAALWDGSISNCVHQNHLIRVRPMEGLLPEYLEVVWNSPENRARLTDVASSSSGLYTLSVSKLKQLSVPVPSIARQRELVDEVLAVTDIGTRLGTSVATAARRKNALRRSLLAAAFSGQLTAEMATA